MGILAMRSPSTSCRRSAGRCPTLVRGRWAARSLPCVAESQDYRTGARPTVSDFPFPTEPPLSRTRGERRHVLRSRGAGHALRVLSTLMVIAGVLALLDAGVTLVWQEPLSALYAKFEQDHLRSALRSVERAQP